MRINEGGKKMKKIYFLFTTVLMFVLFAFSASAATEGYYTYTVSNDKATITYVDTSISGDVTIPSTLDGYSVVAIGGYAFRWCEGLESITIPESVEIVGIYAFDGCENLKSVSLPDNLTSIGEKAFCACKSLESIAIPSSVTSIGEKAFIDCTNKTVLRTSQLQQ